METNETKKVKINGKELTIQVTHNKPSRDGIKKFTYLAIELYNKKVNNAKGDIA